MIQLLLTLALASTDTQDTYQYVESIKQEVDGVACSVDDIRLRGQPGEVCLIDPPKKHIYGDYNVCTYLVTCYKLKR